MAAGASGRSRPPLAWSCTASCRASLTAKNRTADEQPIELLGAELEQLAVADGLNRRRARRAGKDPELTEHGPWADDTSDRLDLSRVDEDPQPARAHDAEPIRGIARAKEPLAPRHDHRAQGGLELPQRRVRQLREQGQASQEGERLCRSLVHSPPQSDGVRSGVPAIAPLHRDRPLSARSGAGDVPRRPRPGTSSLEHGTPSE